LRFVGIQQNTSNNDNTIQKGCKIFDEMAKKDNNWALNSILQFLQYHKERVERKEITGTENSPVVATGPIFSEGGLYHFVVRITTIDYDRSFIPDDKQPVFDGWLSVGSTLNQQVSLSDGKQISIQITS
jgi:hypothetical protein